ncbi:MAG: helix-turn-helix domain-containing protein [Carnobacterium sp.]
MRELLNKQHLRQLELVEYLSYNTCTIADVMKEFSYHIQTVQSYIYEINRIIAPLEIRIDEKKVASIYYPENYSIEYIYSRFIYESSEYELLEKIFFDETKSIDEWAEELFLTSSTLRRSINRMNIELKKESISIEGKKLMLAGNEAKIVHFMVRLFLEKYVDNEVPFNSKQLKAIEILLKYYTKNKSISLNFKDYEIIKNLVLVSIVRVQNQHYVYNHEQDLTKYNNRILKSKMVNLIFKNLFKLELSDELIYRFTYTITSGEYLSAFDDIHAISKNKIKVIENVKMIEEIVDQIQKMLEIPIKNREHLVLSLYNEYAMQYGKNFILYDFSKEFTLSLEKLFPNVTLILKKMLRPLSLTGEEWEIFQYIYLFATHCESFFNIIRTREKKVKIALFSTNDLEYLKFLKEEIYLKFSYHFEVEILNDYSIKDFKLKEYDFDIVITNISGLKFENYLTLCFPIFPQQENWVMLHEAYEKIIKQNNEKK